MRFSSNRYNFCTLFDSYYLTRGVALYRSLELYCDNFHLYIFSFDEKSYIILEKLNLIHATIISLKDFENIDLIRIKPTRTVAEYRWTCTASTIWYSIHKFNLDHCTYLDADMLFFSSPRPIYEEIGSNSVGITPHNFSPKLKSSEIYGKYCVQFNYFKNDSDGLKALNWWKNICIEWCYAKMEDDKYGDQKYLDYFKEKFNNVCEISHIGAGVAPWNISKYAIESIENIIMICQKKKMIEKYPLIFYHFQGLKFNDNKDVVIAEPSFLKIPESGLKYIYEPYINQLIAIKRSIDGNYMINKKIIFQRKLVKSIGIFLRTNLKGYKLVRVIHYLLKKSRYNQPKKIGALID